MMHLPYFDAFQRDEVNRNDKCWIMPGMQRAKDRGTTPEDAPTKKMEEDTSFQQFFRSCGG